MTRAVPPTRAVPLTRARGVKLAVAFVRQPPFAHGLVSGLPVSEHSFSPQ
jgi:hypothetical protein